MVATRRSSSQAQEYDNETAQNNTALPKALRELQIDGNAALLGGNRRTKKVEVYCYHGSTYEVRGNPPQVSTRSLTYYRRKTPDPNSEAIVSGKRKRQNAEGDRPGAMTTSKRRRSQSGGASARAVTVDAEDLSAEAQRQVSVGEQATEGAADHQADEADGEADKQSSQRSAIDQDDDPDKQSEDHLIPSATERDQRLEDPQAPPEPAPPNEDADETQRRDSATLLPFPTTNKNGDVLRNTIDLERFRETGRVESAIILDRLPGESKSGRRRRIQREKGALREWAARGEDGGTAG